MRLNVVLISFILRIMVVMMMTLLLLLLLVVSMKHGMAMVMIIRA